MKRTYEIVCGGSWYSVAVFLNGRSASEPDFKFPVKLSFDSMGQVCDWVEQADKHMAALAEDFQEKQT